MSLTATAPAVPAMPLTPVGNQVIVYTKPSCVQCNATYRALDSKGIDYEVVDLTEDPAALEALRDANWMQAPVVHTAGDIWSGFRPDKIGELAQRVAA